MFTWPVVKSDQAWTMSLSPMWCNPDYPGKIFLGHKECYVYKQENAFMLDIWLSAIVSHETIHDTLNRFGLVAASYALDCLEKKPDTDTDTGICGSVIRRLDRQTGY